MAFTSSENSLFHHLDHCQRGNSHVMYATLDNIQKIPFTVSSRGQRNENIKLWYCVENAAQKSSAPLPFGVSRNLGPTSGYQLGYHNTIWYQ